MNWQMHCHALLTKEDGYLTAITPMSTTETIACTSGLNDKSLAIIHINIEDSPLLTIKNCMTVIEVWDQLEHTCNPKGFTTGYLLL